MKLHLSLGIACLSLAQCAFEPMPTTPSVTPVAMAAERGSDSRDARVWRGTAMHVLAHGSARFVVLATGLGDDAGEGFVDVVEDGYLLVTERTAATSDVPAAWREPRDVVLHGPHGERCRVRTYAVSVLSRFSSNDRSEGYWDGAIDEARGVRVRDHALLNEAWERGSGGRLLAAAIPREGCGGAEWASLPDTDVATFRDSPADPTLRARAIAAMRATARWTELQAELRESPTEDGAPWPQDTLWDTLRGEVDVRVWRAAEGGRTFVSVHASAPFEGCGVFSGELWQFMELVGDRLVQRTAQEGRAAGEVRRVVDTDGDGAPEFFVGDALLWLGPSGYEPVRSVAFPQHGCPC